MVEIRTRSKGLKKKVRKMRTFIFAGRIHWPSLQLFTSKTVSCFDIKRPTSYIIATSQAGSFYLGWTLAKGCSSH